MRQKLLHWKRITFTVTRRRSDDASSQEDPSSIIGKRYLVTNGLLIYEGFFLEMDIEAAAKLVKHEQAKRRNGHSTKTLSPLREPCGS